MWACFFCDFDGAHHRASRPSTLRYRSSSALTSPACPDCRQAGGSQVRLRWTASSTCRIDRQVLHGGLGCEQNVHRRCETTTIFASTV
ncbi:MAG: hypothetical protein IKI31_01335 [Treponema sp.]|nr:hypothetical protein [Treponema sp.]